MQWFWKRADEVEVVLMNEADYRTLDYNFQWEIAKVVNNLKHVAQLQIEATVFKRGHTAQIPIPVWCNSSQWKVSHIPVMV